MTPEEMKGHILRHEGMIASNARGISDLKEEVSLGRSENRLQHSDLGNSIDIVRAGVNEIREKLIYQRGVKHFLTRMRIWPLAAGGILGAASASKAIRAAIERIAHLIGLY